MIFCARLAPVGRAGVSSVGGVPTGGTVRGSSGFCQGKVMRGVRGEGVGAVPVPLNSSENILFRACLTCFVIWNVFKFAPDETLVSHNRPRAVPDLLLSGDRDDTAPHLLGQLPDGGVLPHARTPRREASDVLCGEDRRGIPRRGTCERGVHLPEPFLSGGLLHKPHTDPAADGGVLSGDATRMPAARAYARDGDGDLRHHACAPTDGQAYPDLSFRTDYLVN